MSFNDWKSYKLIDIIEFNPKETIKKKTLSKKISMDKLEPFTRKISGYEEVEFTSGTKFRNGDTLLARITPCLENGKTAQVDMLEENEVAFGSTEYIVLREKLGMTCNDFIYYLAISPEFRSIAIKSMTGSSGRQRVQKDVLEESEIILPPLEEQKAIAKILSDLDEKIETNNKINKNLEEMAQAIFKQWFVDFEFPNEEGKPYKSSGGEMVESELGMIPTGWQIKNIESLAHLEMGVSPSSKSYNYDFDGLPLINGAADFEGKLIRVNKFTNDPKKCCKKGDMIFGVRATIGNTVFADKEYAIGRGVASLREKNIIDRELIYFSLNKEMKSLINSATGSVFVNLKKVDINNVNIFYNERIAEQFNEIVGGILEEILVNDKENERIKGIRDTFLPKLMSGEIRVSSK